MRLCEKKLKQNSLEQSLQQMSAITRNLYREDEVIAAIRWCIVNDRPSQAVFWVQEGLDSDMDVVVLQTLLEVWIYNVGASRLSWFFWFLEGLNGTRPFTEENIVALTVALVNSVKTHGDTTVFAILAIGMEDPPVGGSRAHFAILSSAVRSLDLSKEETSLARALVNGNFVAAWRLAQPLWKSHRAQAILEAMESPQFPLESLGSLYSEEFLWPFRALSLVIAHSTGCLHSTPEPYPRLDPTIWNEWLERRELPMRVRRIYAIPPSCLYSYTKRGARRLNVTTERELIHHLEACMAVSTFWSGLENDFSDDMQRDDFYRRFFPTDIPDEWSTSDRAKSHGSGACPLGSYDAPLALASALRRFFRADAKGIEGGLGRAIAALVSRGANESAFHDFYTRLYKGGET